MLDLCPDMTNNSLFSPYLTKNETSSCIIQAEPSPPSSTQKNNNETQNKTQKDMKIFSLDHNKFSHSFPSNIDEKINSIARKAAGSSTQSQEKEEQLEVTPAIFYHGFNDETSAIQGRRYVFQ